MNNVELRAARKVLDVTIADIASYFAVAVRTWKGWEMGEAPVPAEIDEMLKSVLESRAARIESLRVRKGETIYLDTEQPDEYAINWLGRVIVQSAAIEAFARGYVSLDIKTPLPSVAMRHER